MKNCFKDCCIKQPTTLYKSEEGYEEMCNVHFTLQCPLLHIFCTLCNYFGCLVLYPVLFLKSFAHFLTRPDLFHMCLLNFPLFVYLTWERLVVVPCVLSFQLFSWHFWCCFVDIGSFSCIFWGWGSALNFFFHRTVILT